MTMEQKEDVGECVPNATAENEKAPCLETIYKRLQECNGAIKAIYYDLDYVTRTAPPNPTEDAESPAKDAPTPNLSMMQNQVDMLRDQIRNCKKKLDKARWG